MTKRFLTADSLVRDGFALALAVIESGWRPDHLVGLWRGGSPIAIALHAFRNANTGPEIKALFTIWIGSMADTCVKRADSPVFPCYA